MELTAHQVEMLEGAAALLGTVDREGHPDCARVFGARVDADRKTIRVLLPEAWASAPVRNLRDGGWVALSFTTPTNYESFQAKGRLVRIEKATDEDREIAARHKANFAKTIISIGVDESANYYAHRAEVAITFQVEQLFCQTPGPGAGEPVGGTT